MAANRIGVVPGVKEYRLADLGEGISLSVKIAPPAVPNDLGSARTKPFRRSLEIAPVAVDAQAADMDFGKPISFLAEHLKSLGNRAVLATKTRAEGKRIDAAAAGRPRPGHCRR